MHENRKSLLSTIAVLVLVFAVAISGCQGQQPAAETTGEEPQQPADETTGEEPQQPADETTGEEPLKIQVGTQRGMYAALAFVVKEKGYLEEEGLDPEWNWFSGSPQLLEAMKGGSIDVGLPVGSAPGQVGVGNGLPIKIIANIVWGNEVLVMRKDVYDKVDLNDPETLKGLTVATISKSSMQDYVARLWFEDMGLDPETDVEFREVSAGAAQRSALISGDIDIASTFEPHGTTLQNEGLGVIVGLGEDIAPNHDNTGLVVTNDFLENHRDATVRILRAIEKARVFATENPDEFYAIVAKYFEVDPAIVKASFENRIIVLPDNLEPGVEWYGKVGVFLDKWGYTRMSTDEYLPEYLSAWEEIHKEAGLK